MPRETVRNVIWVVFGDEKINPKGGKVINIAKVPKEDEDEEQE